MAFFPLAAETFGWWHRVGEREVKKLGSDTRDRRKARLSTTYGVVWEFCCSGATLRFWETGFLTSHHRKLMDYISEKKFDLLFSRLHSPRHNWLAVISPADKPPGGHASRRTCLQADTSPG